MRLLYFIMILICGASSDMDAQQKDRTGKKSKATELYQKGEAALLKRDYEKAIQLFNKALQENPELYVAYRALGVCYEAKDDFLNANIAYRKVIQFNPDFSRVLYFEIAQAYYRVGEYAKALDYFNTFDSLQCVPIHQFGYNGEKEQQLERTYVKKTPKNVQACEMALDQSKYENIKEIVNLGGAINSTGDEYFPFISNDQELIYYTYREHSRANENLFFSKVINNDWSPSSPVTGDFNTENNEGMSTFTRDGKRMYFTACSRFNVLGNCDIQVAEMDTTHVLSTKALSGYANSIKWESQASISCDGSLMFFASNRPGGFGGADIWYSNKQTDGSWSEGKNAGSQVNTESHEEAPFITNDGKTLYFSSTGHLGLGEQDLFFSKFEDQNRWGQAINLGSPINSASRELGFFLASDGKTGYLSTNREGGFGGMDIYSFELPDYLYSEATTFVEGFVKDAITEESIQAVLNSPSHEPIQTDANGRFFICLPAGKPFDIKIEKEDYAPFEMSQVIPHSDKKEFYPVNIFLKPIEGTEDLGMSKMDTLKIKSTAQYLTRSIYFDFDQSTLKSESQQELQTLVYLLNEKDLIKIDIHGFSDQVGNADYNYALSNQRADATAAFLKSKGLIVNETTVIGYGEVESDDISAKDRRVEILVVYK